MNPVKKLLAVAGAGLLGALLVPRLIDAQAPGRPESTLTITDPTEVPGGVILEPGSYVVKVANTQANWNVITIQNPDMTKTFATVIATPHTATEATPHTTFVFFNTPAGQPKALRSWFPPNDRFGQDFVYTKARGEELARLTNEKVPEQTPEMQNYEKTETAENNSSTETSTSTTQQMSAENAQPSANTTQNEANPPANTAESTTGSTWRSDTGTSSSTAPESTVAENQQTTTTENENNADTNANTNLPRTASPFPLLALAGAGALGLGLAVRRIAA